MTRDDLFIVRGRRLAAYYLCAADGTYPALEFIEAHPEARPRFLALVQQYVDEAVIKNRQHGHMLDDPFASILELKPKKARMFVFRHGNNCYITNGAMKAKPKEQKRDYQRALDLQVEYFALLSED